jgi:uncharacterized protein
MPSLLLVFAWEVGQLILGAYRYKISSADIAIRCDATIDDLIDILEAKSRSYIPVVYVLNKIDSISIEELDLLYRIPNSVPISSEHGWNIDELMEVM